MTLTTAAIGPRDRWLLVDTASTSDTPFLFTLDAETLRCTGGGGTLLWEVERHVNGTRAVAHASGSTVSEVAPITASATVSGTSSSAPVDLPANANAIGLWANAKASGDHRAIYARLYFAAAGASGEAMRAYGTVSGVAAAGTVNGLHASLIVKTGGSVSGAGHAIRGTFESDASVAVGGTCSVLHLDTSFGASATPSPGMAFISLDNLGTPKPDYMLAITNASAAMVANAGTGANSAAVSTGGVAAKVIKVSVAGVDYWIPLFSSNA